MTNITISRVVNREEITTVNLTQDEVKAIVAAWLTMQTRQRFTAEHGETMMSCGEADGLTFRHVKSEFIDKPDTNLPFFPYPQHDCDYESAPGYAMVRCRICGEEKDVS